MNLNFLPLLSVLFIGLKLTGIIAWSWWWVTLPLWAEPAFMFLLVFFGFLSAVVSALCDRR